MIYYIHGGELRHSIFHANENSIIVHLDPWISAHSSGTPSHPIFIGAYYVGSVATHRLITIAISKACNSRVFAVNYRLAPETRFPEPLLDVVNGYFRLIDDLGIEGRNIVRIGGSRILWLLAAEKEKGSVRRY